jgi:periplasmic divalent cation tolerance protein
MQSQESTDAPIPPPVSDRSVAVAVIVTCHIDDAAVARELVETCIAARLAACGHVGAPEPARYWWQGEIVHDSEFLIRLVTATDRVEDLVEALGAAHPYEVPDIMWTSVATTPAYADWLTAHTRDSGG